MNEVIDLSSNRAKEARFGKAIGKDGYLIFLGLSILSAVSGVVLLIIGTNHIFIGLFGSISALCIMPALWWKERLSVLPPESNDIAGRLSADVYTRLVPGMALNPQTVWAALYNHWQAYFFTNHLLLSGAQIQLQLTTNPADLEHALQVAGQLADSYNAKTIELGFVIAGLMMSSAGVSKLLVQNESQPEDIKAVAEWLGRNVNDSIRPKGTLQGGIGRDWAFGFTPLLDRLGHNISLSISDNGANYDWLANSEGVKSIEKALENNSSAVVLIGPVGIGKTNNVYALAQRMLEGNTATNLKFHQIINLNATDITSRAQGPGDLESIMIRLVNEASHAGHIILFFDDAQSFFKSGPGSFDASQILLSIIQARVVPLILALDPNEYQKLKVSNQTLAGLMTPVVLQELPEASVMRVIEDISVGLESHYKVMISYEAMREAYRLSGRYEQEEAYPGKAIKLLEQAINHADHEIISRKSVQQAIEQTRGVRLGKVKPAETETLLNLEDKIHERMINQSHAVNVVSSSLRRARAGVTNPKRPIGSFLFLGPTGVGKTELAKAIASTYFGSQESMIRLDMSEYQQPDDVKRLLSTGENETSSLLMRVRQQPFAVVLLDEIEKSHTNVLNLLLQMLDEGQLTDLNGKAASFKDCIIIVTSNAGADIIRDRIDKGETLESFAPAFSEQLIASGQFKPELLNRFDETVLFRPLTIEELGKVVRLMVAEVNTTLTNQNISFELTDGAVSKIVSEGNDPKLGARPMRRMLQRAVEDTIAEMILRQEAKPGDHVIIDTPNLKI
ncbi:MAG: AAA family ATPase [Candidatus Saccharimonadales bacterium]